MAKAAIQIKYTCGCGFRTDKLDEAVQHVEKTGHSMTVLGMIRADKSSK